MPSYVTPKRGIAYVFQVGLFSQANAALLQVSPTLAAGDVKISLDGGALANLATLPVVTPAGSRGVLVSLSAGEMTADTVRVEFVDAAGAEWCDLLVSIQTTARQLDDLAYPTVAGTGSVAQTGDVYPKVDTEIAAIIATLGAAGAGLTALGDTRLANLDATISSRTKPADTQARVTLVDTLTTYTGNTPQTGDVYPKVDTEIAAIIATLAGLSPLDAAGMRAALGLASANLDTQLDAIPTNAELATALGTADDATLAVLVTVNATLATIAGYLDTEVAAILAKVNALPTDPADASDVAAAVAALSATLVLIKAKTDSLTFTVATVLDANVQRINDVAITGDGDAIPFGV